ncbi:uncharacterized protein [Erythrolamprus reginae]
MASLPKRKQPSGRRPAQLAWLLTAHLVTSYFMLIQAEQPPDFTITFKPPHPTEGDDVQLIPKKPTNDTSSCSWFRGDNVTYIEIMVYFPLNRTTVPLRGFFPGCTATHDCVLTIHNISYQDMALYGVLMTTPKKSFLGRGFLEVTRVEMPMRILRSLGAGVIAGISAGCLIGILLITGLVAYHVRRTNLRRANTTQPASNTTNQDTSANKEGNSQNADAEGNKT